MRNSFENGGMTQFAEQEKWEEPERAKLQNVCNIHLLRIDYIEFILLAENASFVWIINFIIFILLIIIPNLLLRISDRELLELKEVI